MKTFFSTKDQATMEITQSNVPTYQATFHKRQQAPPINFGKPEWGKPRINLTKADDLVAQTANRNTSFWDKTRVAKRQKNGIKENAVPDKKEVPQKPLEKAESFGKKVAMS